MKKILIVDDEKAVFVLLKKIIEDSFGFETVWAENGLQAIKKLEDSEFAAVLLDLDMPVMGGLETIKVIRKDKDLDNIPILMCSSSSDRESISALIPYRITDYILKPIVSEEVVKKLIKHFII